jgi:hypothetical protein
MDMERSLSSYEARVSPCRTEKSTSLRAEEARNASGDFAPVSFAAFESAYKALTEKLQPMVYELGFLKA